MTTILVRTKEAEEIIANAENAYENGEISFDELLWLRTLIAKEQLEVKVPENERES